MSATEPTNSARISQKDENIAVVSEVSAPARPVHWVQLDGLRGLAVSAVVMHHYLWEFFRSNFGGSAALAAVRLFFVLSGFLITGILLRARRDVDLGKLTFWAAIKVFYIRRSLRIFPLYYLVIAVAVAVGLPYSREKLVWLAAYLVNVHVVTSGEWVGYFSHFWTLCVEEQFYLVWPFVILLLPSRLLFPAIMAMIILPSVLQGWWLFETQFYTLDYSYLEAWGFRTWLPMWMNLDTLGSGAALAVISTNIERRDRFLTFLQRFVLPLALVLWFLPIVWKSAGLFGVWKSAAQSVVFVWLVALAARGFSGWLGKVLEWEPLRHLGKISYGVYVYHMFALPLTAWLLLPAGIVLRQTGLVGMLLACAVTGGMAALSWRWFEAPLNALKDRVSPATARS